MKEGTCFALGSPNSPLHGRGGFICFESPRVPLHEQGGLLRFGTTEAPAAWARGPPSLWDHRGSRRRGKGASSACARPVCCVCGVHGHSALVHRCACPVFLVRGVCGARGHLAPVHPWAAPRPPLHRRGGRLRFGITAAPAALARGPFLRGDHRGPCHVGREGLLLFRTIGAPASWARGLPLLWNHRGPCRMGVGASFALGPLRRVPHG